MVERLRLFFSSVATHLLSNRSLYVRLKEIVKQIYNDVCKKKKSIYLNIENINVVLIVMIKYKHYRPCKIKSLELQYSSNVLRLNSPVLSVNVLFIKFNWAVTFSRIYFGAFQIGFKITLFRMLRLKDNMWVGNTHAYINVLSNCYTTRLKDVF